MVLNGWVSGDDEGDSESSSEDDRDSVHSNDGEVGLKSLLDDGDENISSEMKVIISRMSTRFSVISYVTKFK